MDIRYNSGLPIVGTDKYTGRHVSYLSIKIGGVTKQYFAWARFSGGGSIDFRDNTNAGSSLIQMQPTREEPPSFEIETEIPYDEGDAAEIIWDLRAGQVLDGFNVGARVDEAGGLYGTGTGGNYLEDYGKWVIERSSIDIDRDDMTKVRATIRALGYTNAQSLPELPPMTGSDSGTLTANVTESTGTIV